MNARPDIWDMSAAELHGFALGLERALAMASPSYNIVPDHLRREASIARGFAARLQAGEQQGRPVVAVPPPPPAPPLAPLPTPVAAAPQPTPQSEPPPTPPPAPAPKAAKAQRGSSAWTEERRKRHGERMRRLVAEGKVKLGRKPKDRPAAAPPEPQAEPVAPEPEPVAGREPATAEDIEEWLVKALVEKGESQPAVEGRLVLMTSRQVLNTANAQRRLRGEPEFVVVEEEAA